MSIKALQDYTFYAKYSNWKNGRRETWKEAVNRVKNMMLTKYKDYPEVHKDIEFAYEMMYQRKVLGSQRALQFGGEEILRHNMKIFNCLASYCDRPRFFQETMYLLLCGCGTGFSIQKHHIERLPKVIKKEGSAKFIVQDSIEGWSDAVGVLVCSYFENDTLFPEYNGKHIDFDFSLVRPEGSPIGKNKRKAPGSAPLKRSLLKIKDILESVNNKLKPIEAYDIVMHISDAVLSGGIRRSATLCMFSYDDEEMLKAKTGNWYYENPQRARSNNSALLLKDGVSFDEFHKIMESVKEFGEPGYIWSENSEQLFNPSLRRGTKIITSTGIYNIEELQDKDIFVPNLYGELQPAKCRLSGKNKELWRIELSNNIVYYATKEHKWPILVNHMFRKVETANLKCGDKIPTINKQFLFNHTDNYTHNQGFMIGYNLGDGWITTRQDNNKKQYGFIVSEKESYIKDILDATLMEIKQDSINRQHKWTPRQGVNSHTYECNLQSKAINLFFEQVGCTHKDNGLPTYVWKSSEEFRKGVIDGLFSSDGYVGKLKKSKNQLKIAISSKSQKLILDLQELLGFYGIDSKIFYRKIDGSKTRFPNGKIYNKIYHRWTLVIRKVKDQIKFAKTFKLTNKSKDNYLEQYRTDDYYCPKNDFITVKSVEQTELTEDVWDISVYDNTHCFQLSHCITGNCVEASFYPVSPDGESSWQACNLSTINWGKIKTEEEFYDACKAASIIGTLQAGFTEVGYLTQASKETIEREALLGVSGTGWLEKPDISLNENIQQRGAKIVVDTNQEIAKKIQINPSARTTLVKPEGSSSCMLGTSSGIHPHNSKRYIRRVQANRNEILYQFFKTYNPKACEESAWSANNTDDVISFCIEVPDGSKTKNQMSAIELLEIVKKIQQNWVQYGKVNKYCRQPWLSHNVSNTINVKADEWEDVTKYIYENRKYFAGISLLPVTGDKDYKQAPFTTVYLPSEMSKYYGNWIVFVAGLIESGLNLFDDDLWSACDALLNKIPIKGKAKEKWKNRCIKFADSYTEGNIKQLTYAMKDVYNYKLWTDLNREYQDVDYTLLEEKENNTNYSQESVCAGGSCEIMRF